MKNLLLILILLSQFVLPEIARAEDIVQRFVGVWVGEGQVRPQGFDEVQKIRCKVTGERMSEVQISYAGRCATTTGVGTFRLLLAQDATGKRYAAKMQFSTGKADVEFKGQVAGDTITLLQTKELAQNNRVLLSEITLDLPLGKDITMTNNVTDQVSGETAQSLEIRFTRRE